MPEPSPAVVFDTNVYVDAIIGPDSQWPLIDQLPPATDNAAADCLSLAFDAEDFRLFTSPHILTNITRLLHKVGVAGPTTEQWINAILDIVDMTGGLVVDPDRTVFDIGDYEDNLIIDLAVAVDAILVVSEDTDLTALSPWQGRIPILRPREFVLRTLQARRHR